MATLPQPVTQQPPAQQPAQNFGPNFEQLPERLKKALWRIITELELEDDLARRRELRNILQRRLFFKGRQFDWWSETDGQYFPAGVTSTGLNQGTDDDDDDQQAPAFQHCTNVFQATCLTLAAVLTQDPIAARFWPQSPSDPKDVQTAKNGTKVVDIIHRNNDQSNKLDECAYYMCTDGFLGAYVRYVSDGEAYGYDQQDEMGAMEVPIGDPQVQCASCGFSEPGTSEAQPVCPQCGNPTADIPPEIGNISYPTGNTIETPKGQEVITVVPALQLKRSMWADEQREFLYLTWVRDVHKAKVKSIYPHIAQKLDSGPSTGDTGTTSESYEKIARRLLYQGAGYVDGGVNDNMGTFRSAWLRPSSFWKVADGCTMGRNPPVQEPCDCLKCQLIQIYPHGAYVAFYGEVYCESRDECMDEKWECMHTMPGEGQNRETLMSASVAIQEQLNDCVNLIFEQAMYGVPEAFGDQHVIDFEARAKQGALPGNMTPVDLQPNQRIGDFVMFSPAVNPSEALMQYKDELMGNILQYLTGAYPALFGGDTGGNDTASGIATQRNQAMGRIGRAWKRLQIFWSNIDGKAVKCFAKNRQNDLEIPKETNSGEWESDWVRIEDMQGNVVAYPEVDQQFPTMQSEVRSLMMSLLNEGNPLFMAVAQAPENMEYVFRELGLSDIEVPGEQQRVKTYKQIEQLLQEQPQPGPPQPVQPQPGQQSPAQGPQGPSNSAPSPRGSGAPEPHQPMQPGPMLPSVQPDPLIDDLPVAAATVKQWFTSDAGMRAENSNPAGYANVYLFLKTLVMMQKAKELQQAIAQQSLAGQGPMADPGGAEAISQPQPPQPPVSPKSGNGSQPSTA